MTNVITCNAAIYFQCYFVISVFLVFSSYFLNSSWFSLPSAAVETCLASFGLAIMAKQTLPHRITSVSCAVCCAGCNIRSCLVTEIACFLYVHVSCAASISSFFVANFPCLLRILTKSVASVLVVVAGD